eukprot:scaffold2028_cov353-Pavlova_lutheri.AAC.18
MSCRSKRVQEHTTTKCPRAGMRLFNRFHPNDFEPRSRVHRFLPGLCSFFSVWNCIEGFDPDPLRMLDSVVPGDGSHRPREEGAVEIAVR